MTLIKYGPDVLFCSCGPDVLFCYPRTSERAWRRIYLLYWSSHLPVNPLAESGAELRRHQCPLVQGFAFHGFSYHDQQGPENIKWGIPGLNNSRFETSHHPMSVMTFRPI